MSAAAIDGESSNITYALVHIAGSIAIIIRIMFIQLVPDMLSVWFVDRCLSIEFCHASDASLI